jgi:hypothetical protein
MSASFARAAGADDRCISPRSLERRRSQSFSSSPCMRGSPQRGLASAIVRISERTSAATVGRPVRRRLFQVHQNWKPRRCHAMTVYGLTIRSAVRHSVQTRDSTIQRQRSVVVRRSRRGRARCSTCSWCCNARISSWSAGRERADFRRANRSDKEQRHDRLAAYRSEGATSMATTGTGFSVGTTIQKSRSRGPEPASRRSM